MVGKSSETITAEALVERAAPLYLGFETKLSSPEAACSMPLRPVISVSGEPFSRRAFRAEAMAESFIGNGKMTHRSYTRRRLRQMVGNSGTSRTRDNRAAPIKKEASAGVASAEQHFQFTARR